jgi:hypothetical protein
MEFGKLLGEIFTKLCAVFPFCDRTFPVLRAKESLKIHLSPDPDQSLTRCANFSLVLNLIGTITSPYIQLHL